MSFSTRRQQQDEYSTHQEHEAIIRSIDETKQNIQRAMEETRREAPKYSQTIIDFQNETAEATREIADNFLESQAEIINSMEAAWTPMAQRAGREQEGYNWIAGMTEMPFFYFSPRQMADMYARTIGAMAEAYAASTRIATNLAFAGMEVTRATTNYARQNSKEAARITSDTARTFGRTARETVQVDEGERREGGRGGTAGSSYRGGGRGAGLASGSLESRGGADTTTTTAYTSEGSSVAPGSGTGSSTTTTTGTTTSLSDTNPGFADKTRKK
jgi:hypothetical protein